MDAIFSEEELLCLQTKPWWVACSETPFLIRSAIYQTTILLTITDAKSMWATRVDQATLRQQKEIFAKTLEMSSFKELLNLFEGILSNPEKKALYQFVKKKDGDLGFRIEKQIEVYPFTWKFDLIEVNCDITAIICKEILNPITRTLHAQEKRYHIMRRKMETLEKDLMKKMTETEKHYYRSPLVEDQMEMKLLVDEPREQEFIVDLRVDPSSKIFFQNSMLATKKNQQHNEKKNLPKTTKVQKRVAGYNQPNVDELINQLEMKKQEEKEKKNKKKNVDFL